MAIGGAPTRRASHSSNWADAVPEYTVADDIPYRQSVEVTDYPRRAIPTAREAGGRAGGGRRRGVGRRTRLCAR